MGRSPCCEKAGLKKGRWTAEEDEILVNFIRANEEGSWRSLPKNAGLLRCGKSCRLRWISYLRAGLKRDNTSPEEADIIINLHASFGNRWSLIASHLPGRTDNDIKNYWNSHLCRRIPKANIPSKHKSTPKTQRPNSTHHVYEAVPLPNTPVLENERIPTAFDDLLVQPNSYEENKEEGKETNQTLGA